MNVKTPKSIFGAFPRTFWVANGVEVFEHAAFYGVFVVITLYLSRILGFNDIQAAWISGGFSAGLFFLPTLTGALADKIGFRKSLLLAFGLLTIGYAGLGIFPAMLEGQGLVKYGHEVVFQGLQQSDMRWNIVPIMIVIMVGGSFSKAVITGTVAKETTESNRAKGFTIFYTLVNVGAFSGKVIVEPFRESMGDLGLINLNYFAALMTLLAFICILLFYKSTAHNAQPKSLLDTWRAMSKVLTNGRLVALILIISGFWMVQHQLYATMPKYVLRMIGEVASPAWYATINPFVVVVSVGMITTMMKKYSALFSMMVGMLIMPLAVLIIASGNLLDGDMNLGFIQIHPIAFTMIIGVILLGLAESFVSPRFLELFSLQAPKGEEGLYLGFSHLHSFISSLIGFGFSGYLLEKYCPDPRRFETHEAWTQASSNAHYIWYIFVGVSLLSVISLFIYGVIYNRPSISNTAVDCVETG
jgi:dipeptide/tripeptide permease